MSTVRVKGMKSVVSFFFSVFFLLGVNSEKNEKFEFDFRIQQDPRIQSTAVRGLADRLIGKASNLFDFHVDPNISTDGRDTYQILKTNNDVTVSVKGSNGVAAAAGLHHYLKLCGCHISWDGDQLRLPPKLPSVNVTTTAMDQLRYYQNVCTASYSSVWWDWPRWEREIDWIALNGINLALAGVGQEAVWAQVYSDMSLTLEEIDDFFAGPAFLAWNRMGNLRGWLGPLPQSWHQHTIHLQRKIIKRMTQFGITPVVPAFTGIVPRAFERIYPEVNFTKMNKWNNFPDQYCCPYLLSPTDPVFQEVGIAFLKKYEQMFGLYHVYNCDTFNENNPASGDLDYLRDIGSGIHQAMMSVDEKAIWLLQGWMFYNERDFWTEERTKALLTSVPQGKMVILDLQSELNPQYERLNSYYGQPFIWCMLHNFGGTLGLHGATERLNKVPYEVRNNSSYSMVGIGLTPEGIDTNYIMYDFMLEVGWNPKPVDTDHWFKDYARRRYGMVDNSAEKAWIHLKNSVYNYTSTVPEHGQYIITSRPSLKLSKDVWYNPRDVFKAHKFLLAVSNNFSSSDIYKHDLVDVTRQSLQLLVDDYYEKVVASFQEKDLDGFRNNSKRLRELLKDMDDILQTHTKFLIGPWISNSRSLGTTVKEKNLYEENARNQITLWGPEGQIIDYANKQWSGIMKDYYAKRWEIFLSALEESLKTGKDFNQVTVDKEMFDKVEKPFSSVTEDYPTLPTGDAADVSKKIFDKWIRNSL